MTSLIRPNLARMLGSGGEAGAGPQIRPKLEAPEPLTPAFIQRELKDKLLCVISTQRFPSPPQTGSTSPPPTRLLWSMMVSRYRDVPAGEQCRRNPIWECCTKPSITHPLCCLRASQTAAVVAAGPGGSPFPDHPPIVELAAVMRSS